MTEEFKKYEKTIPKRHSIRFIPQYQESFQTNLKASLFLPIAKEVIQQLDWSLSYPTQTLVEAKYEGHRNRWTEKITMAYEQNMDTITVKSQTLTGSIWDNGNNSKRVRLFIHAFQQTLAKYDQEELVALEKEVEREKNGGNYELPTSLPQPHSKAILEPWLIMSIGIISALLLGFIMAFVSLKTIYIFGLFEGLIVLVLGVIMRRIIQMSNYTHYKNLETLLSVLVLTVYISNQYFQYYLITEELHDLSINFLAFIQFRLAEGLLIKGFNFGWIGLVVNWLFQLLFTFYLTRIRLVATILVYQVNRIPDEVIQFVKHFFLKEKNIGQIRYELAQMGWKEESDQDEVFDALGAGVELVEFHR